MAEERRLSTILFADIAGYTALMQEDEERALQLLNHFKETLEDQVLKFQGEIIQYFGDGALLSFDSATLGVQCGENLQQIFREQGSPVRMGMHLGEVVFRNKNLFGDGVNIASRIESIGVPGALLVSKTIRDQVRNKMEFQLTSLGTFHFKNVTDPIEVFALANEGMVVPDRKKLRGKLKERKTVYKRPFAIGAAALIGLLFLLWYFLPGTLMEQKDPSEKVIPSDIRKKRVAVMVFDNQTFNPEYNAFGKMISDWITHGLMETGEVNVINAANIEPQIEGLNTGTEANPKFASATGIDMMLKGRYYRIDSRLAIQANLIDARNGEVIHAMDRIEGSEQQLPVLLRQLTQETLGYWAVKDLRRFLENPPQYDAYREWLEADRYVVADPEQAAGHFRKAYELDSTFYSPLLTLYQLYSKEGKYELQDSLFQFLAERVDRFTRWEKLRFDELKAIRNRNWESVARLSEKRYRKDPSDQMALNQAITAYSYINYPSKSIELIRDFDPVFLNSDLKEISWLETNQIFPNMQLGNYAAVDRIASQYDRPKLPDAIAVLHMKALVQLDSMDRLDRYYQLYKQSGVFNTSGNPTPFYTITALLCDELLITGKRSPLEKYAADLESADGDQPAPYDQAGYAHFYGDRYRLAAESWEKHKINKQAWPGWLWITLEFDRLSRIGHCYARIGEKEMVQTYLEKVNEVPGDHPATRGISSYYQARILAAAGEKDKAIRSLRQALQEGFHFFGPVRYTYDPFLMPLFEEEEFKALVRRR